jgi:hypothetical protein
LSTFRSAACKVTLELNINEREFAGKYIAIYNIMNIRPVGADFLPRAQGRTDGWTEKHGEYKLSQFFQRVNKKRTSVLSRSLEFAFRALFD